ncbi:MAG: phosphoribosylaminoimidazolesuccinocarboxamide synthase, partial [Pseudomonadota bacterium]
TGDHLLLIATDRISAFDVVLPIGIPGKGRVLTQISIYWFEQMKDIVSNHIEATDLKDFPEPPKDPQLKRRPTVLYNAMIRPLIPFTIRGVIWYQGESNASRAYQYRYLFPNLIENWRKAWNQGDFPFLFVQIANHLDRLDQPGESRLAELREAQAMALILPNTATAVAIDNGDEEGIDVHPKNKQEVRIAS